jgi:hypothetical protein
MMKILKKLGSFATLCCASVSGQTNTGYPEFKNRTTWLKEFPDMGRSLKCITFEQYPVGTPITNQFFATTCVTFTDGDDNVTQDTTLFPINGFGLEGGAKITIDLGPDKEGCAVGVDFLGSLRMRLADQNGNLVYLTDNFGGFGPGKFGGVIVKPNNKRFTRIVLENPFFPTGPVNIERICIQIKPVVSIQPANSTVILAQCCTQRHAQCLSKHLAERLAKCFSYCHTDGSRCQQHRVLRLFRIDSRRSTH